MFLLGAVTSGAASTPVPQLAAERMRADESVTLDGKLDETVWTRAAMATDFRQREPREGAAATQRTEVRVVYDKDTLFIGARMLDDEPDGILGRQRRRDAFLGSDDVFQVVIDPFSDGRVGYLFETNPEGLLGDALIDRFPNDSWDAIWDVRAIRTVEGWQAEFEIPFRTLNFNPGRDTWSMNFQRTVRRDNETSLWTGFLRSQGLFDTLYAGRVTGLTDLSQGVGLEIQPYALVRHSHFSGVDAETDTEWGLDVTYSLTPNLRAALTINTDFADTEVDNRRLNLGRFPIRFPEKRDFFLEGSSVFSFPGDNRVTPYYSRRVGLSDDGPVPIAWGGRLAGQVGIFDLGVLQIRTKAAHGIDAEDFTVFRTRGNYAEDSYVGLLYTRREGNEPEARQTVGADADIRVIDFGDGESFAVRPYAIWTSRAPGDDSSSTRDRSILGLQQRLEVADFNLFASVHETGENYDPAVGFAFDTGYREYDARLSYSYQPENPRIQHVEHEFDYERREDLEGELIESSLSLGLVDIEFGSGDNAGISLDRDAELLDEDFNIWEDVVVPAGRYSGWGLSVEMRTADKRSWSADLEVSRREFFTGYRNSYETRMSIRPARGLDLGVSVELERISFPGGGFTTRLLSGRINYAMTTQHLFNLLGQYDNDSDSFGLQFRYRWIPRPGSEVFVGYLHDWVEVIDPTDGGRTWQTIGRESAVKAGYAWWF